MTTLCFYRMTHDTGFAPNPFHGYCTVATCTPNHMRARLKEGDYIVGIEGVKLRKKRKKKRGQNQSSSEHLCIIYFMKIDGVLTLTKYFNDDHRFDKKKCNPNGSDVERVGDNVYWFDGQWNCISGHGHHGDEHLINQDTCGDRVFISSGFSYFGDRGIPLPPALLEHVPRGQGMKYARHATTDLVEKLEDLGSQRGKGLVGQPIDPPHNLILDLSGTSVGCK